MEHKTSVTKTAWADETANRGSEHVGVLELLADAGILETANRLLDGVEDRGPGQTTAEALACLDGLCTSS